MKVYNDPLITIYFGNAQAQVERDLLIHMSSQEELWRNDKLTEAKKMMNLDTLYLLKQEHGARGYRISKNTSTEFLAQKPTGDFLVTEVMHSGLAVYTADCLPIVIYDLRNHVVGICHAGWRGSVAMVASTMLNEMYHAFGTDAGSVRVFFGPSAKVCCYSVAEDFKENFVQFPYSDSLFVRENGRLFFDLPYFNRIQLEACGVAQEAFCYEYNECTIENSSFCSVRRGTIQDRTARQLTIVSLKEFA
ncbi:polyphenol oxidase family protein [Candidatus Dependentiae bacterium]|nr:polyphenol oxidase family protein [Candidatus Dependentiae bacterium]